MSNDDDDYDDDDGRKKEKKVTVDLYAICDSYRYIIILFRNDIFFQRV